MAKKKIPPEKYWQNRFEILTAKQFTASEEYMKELEHQYHKASIAIQKDVRDWYARFATNNQISMQAARKILSGNELREFRWTAQEYIEKAKLLDVDPSWLRYVENASAKVHVSRLEALQLQMQNHIETLYGGQEKGFKKILSSIYADQYYHTGFEIQKGIGVGSTFAKLDSKTIERVITTPWTNDDQTFSKRIWGNRTKLLGDVRNALSQAIIRGENPSVFNEKLAKMFKTSQSNAGRLLMTESAFFASAAEKDAYKTLGIERYQIVATLDQKTSDICIDMDGKDFALSEYDIGITAPPFHPWCRTTTVPYFNDEFTVNEYRAARSATDGEVYYIPADIKYKDWFEQFVKPGEKLAEMMKNSQYKIIDGIIYFPMEEPKPEIPKNPKLVEIENKIAAKEKELEEAKAEQNRLYEKRPANDPEYMRLRDKARSGQGTVEELRRMEELNKQYDEVRDKYFKFFDIIKKLEEELEQLKAEKGNLFFDRENTISAIIKKFKDAGFSEAQANEYNNLVILKLTEDELKMYNYYTDNIASKNYYLETKKNTGYFSPGENRVHMNISNAHWEHAVGRNNATIAIRTKAHEEFHQLDHQLIRIDKFSKNGMELTDPQNSYGRRIADAIENDVIQFINKAADDFNAALPKEDKSNIIPHVTSLDRLLMQHKMTTISYLQKNVVSEKEKALLSAFTDAIGLATKGRIHPYSHYFWGHKMDYCQERGLAGATSECWAEVGAFLFNHDQEPLNYLQKFCPNTISTITDVYNEVISYLAENGFRNV